MNFPNIFKTLFGKHSELEGAWKKARRKWLSKERVFAGKTGKFLKISGQAQCLLDLVRLPGASDFLYNHLDDADARISTYCLMGLELLNSDQLEKVEDLLAVRKDSVILLAGSTIVEIPLSDLAEEAVARHARGASLERWIAFGVRMNQEKLKDYLKSL